ncbi:MAG: hypothetical protein WCK65_06260 [Rhodospirillaceae bacterium]
MGDSQRFVKLGLVVRRVWAVASVHAEIGRLAELHDKIGVRFRPGDRLIYLGNMIGRGRFVAETIDELLAFRRALLAVPGVMVADVVYLRGGQEEMWQKLLQLQLAPNPKEIIAWMLSQGVGTTLDAYGSSAEQAVAAARDGVRTITRYTGALRTAMRDRPGHETLFSALRRAAFTGSPQASPEPESIPNQDGLLLVNSGFDISRPFESQGDAFWWGADQFSTIDRRYGGFARIVRGYDPSEGGVSVDTYTTTLDGGCGFGGKLVCGCLSPSGELLETIET